jgi:hypothetical protein
MAQISSTFLEKIIQCNIRIFRVKYNVRKYNIVFVVHDA